MPGVRVGAAVEIRDVTHTRLRNFALDSSRGAPWRDRWRIEQASHVNIGEHEDPLAAHVVASLKLRATRIRLLNVLQIQNPDLLKAQAGKAIPSHEFHSRAGHAG